MKKRVISMFLLIMLVGSLFSTSYAATSIPEPFYCPVCGINNDYMVKIATMWTTSNPPQIYYEVWLCANGHEFKNWPSDYVIAGN